MASTGAFQTGAQRTRNALPVRMPARVPTRTTAHMSRRSTFVFFYLFLWLFIGAGVDDGRGGVDGRAADLAASPALAGGALSSPSNKQGTHPLTSKRPRQQYIVMAQATISSYGPGNNT